MCDTAHDWGLCQPMCDTAYNWGLRRPMRDTAYDPRLYRSMCATAYDWGLCRPMYTTVCDSRLCRPIVLCLWTGRLCRPMYPAHITGKPCLTYVSRKHMTWRLCWPMCVRLKFLNYSNLEKPGKVLWPFAFAEWRMEDGGWRQQGKLLEMLAKTPRSTK